MSDYELLQLVIATRWERDLPAFLFIALTTTMICLSLWKDGMLAQQSVRLLKAFYLFASSVLAVNGISATLRLHSLVATEFSQWLSYALTLAVLVVGIYASLHCLDKATKPYSN